MTPATTTTQPTPESVDKMIAGYQERLHAAEAAQQAVEEYGQQLMRVVQEHGVVPESASQSRRLQGVHSEATVTTGITRSLHEPSIQQLREYMVKQSIAWIFKKMFAETTKYTLIDGARDVLNGIDLPKRTREKVLQFFGMCIVVKDQKPKLTVKAVKPKAAKKPRVSATKGKAVA